MAQALEEIQKIVFSSALTASTWNNTTIFHTLTAEQIMVFKQAGNKGLLTFGSLSLVEALIEMHLVDEFYFNIQPLIPGKGQGRFFSNKNMDVPLPLKYIKSVPLRSGAHIIHYQNVVTSL
jgi:dihydrofolate reductase